MFFRQRMQTEACKLCVRTTTTAAKKEVSQPRQIITMKKRRKFGRIRSEAPGFLLHPRAELLLLLLFSLLQIQGPQFVGALMSSKPCLSGTLGCGCLWKSGKFVANCSGQSLTKVPNNDYYDYLLANAGNNQMPTLNRDIQQLDLASNSIANLGENEFLVKKFKNLQKIYLNANQLLQVHSNAFHKLTGLVELDLSDNMIADLSSSSSSKEPDNEQQSAPEEQTTSWSAEESGSRKRPSKTKKNKSKKVTSFLGQLTQLRQLNLASNQLTKLQEFAFSQVKQLRQLYLSRNKISYIDKRAFDGLNVLNILHLDGNKLSHLNGEILAQLPQLHSLQLAGSNPWICDCGLRKLVRKLLGDSNDSGALIRENKASILQDEPRCLGPAANGGKLSDSSGVSGLLESSACPPGGRQQQQQQQQMEKKGPHQEEESSRWDCSWTNMKLDQLECPPRLRELPPVQNDETEAGQLAEIRLEMLMDSPEEGAPHVINKIDKTAGKQTKAAENGADKFLLSETKVPTIRHHYLADELLQLTCSFELNDELDLDYSRLEWWLITSNHHHPNYKQPPAKQARLIWNSRWQQGQTKVTTTMKDEPGGTSTGTKKLAFIMDYVTRARSSSSSSLPAQGAPMNQSEPIVARLAQGGRLVRVSHLIADAAKLAAGNNRATPKQQAHDAIERRTTMGPQTAELLCRITNQAGHAELLHSVLVDSNNRRAQLAAQARKLSQESWLRRPENGAADDRPAAGNSIQPVWTLDRAKARIAEELEESLSSESDEQSIVNEAEQPLFIPLHLSRELVDPDYNKQEIDLDHLDTNSDDLASRGLSQQQQQQQSDLHQRQATRQTNATASSPKPSSDLANSTTVKFLPSATYRQRLQSKAQALIRRFTTSSASDDDQHGDFGSEAAMGTFQSGSNEQPNRQHGQVRLWLRSVYVRYLDRWLQLAVGEAPLLLGICAGLFVGCLLTTFFILRLHCTKQRRVAPEQSSVCAPTTDQQLKSSQTDGSTTDCYAEINSPGDNYDDITDGDKVQPTGCSSSETATTNDLSQRKLISTPLPDELDSGTKLATSRSMTLARDGRTSITGLEFSQSGPVDLVQTCRLDRNYSTLDCGRHQLTRHHHEDPEGGHRLIVMSPQQEMQELILSPYSPFGSELAPHHQPFVSSGGDLCQQVVSTGWQSPYGYQEAPASSSSPSTTFQDATRRPQLMMNAPSKLSSVEALDSYYQNPDARKSTSLSRTFCAQDRPSYDARVARVAGPNYAYASSSSLVTSPAASTSSTSMTSGNPMMQQHAMYACNHNGQQIQPDNQDMNHHHLPQNHVIYLDDALKLLHSSINDCL